MKTPISYYGGKQLLSSLIVGLIPKHRLYCEPFFGGGAVFFAKEPSDVEVINDTNKDLINFYEVVKENFAALEHEISLSLHSRDMHRQAEVIYSNPDMFGRVKRAWAVWMLANTSYGCRLDGSFGYDRKGSVSKKLDNKREAFTEEYAKRLRKVQIECCDAIRIIKSRDTADSFFYIDPPYVGSDQGHYDGYTQEDFDILLNLLDGIKGKFILSSYRNTSLKKHILKNGWYTAEIRMHCSMTSNSSHAHGKIEVLTANFPFKLNLDGTQKKLISEED
ncbi:MAG: DNA adenine methylase [Treponema sp.]|nr:DNA adenine methylase [Treponema sp.]